MNTREAIGLLHAAADALLHPAGPVDPEPFHCLIRAAAEQEFPLGDPRRALADGGQHLLRVVAERHLPPTSTLAQVLAQRTALVLIRTAQAAAATPVDLAELCPCITVRLWHPAVKAATALTAAGPYAEECAAVLEALR